MSRPKLPDFTTVIALAEQTDCRVSLIDLARMHKHGEYSEQAVDVLWPDATPRAKAFYMGLKRYEGKPHNKCGNTTRHLCNNECVVCGANRAKAYRIKNRESYMQNKRVYAQKNREYINMWYRANYANNRDELAAKQRARYAARKQQEQAA